MAETPKVKPQRCSLYQVPDSRVAILHADVKGTPAIAIPTDLAAWDDATRERVVEAMHGALLDYEVSTSDVRYALRTALAALADATREGA